MRSPTILAVIGIAVGVAGGSAPLYLPGTAPWVWGIVFWAGIATIIGAFVWGVWLAGQKRIEQRVNNDPTADAPVQEVFRYLLLDSQWALGRDGSSDDFYTDIEGEVRDAASLGRARVWARPYPKFGSGGFRETPFEVPRDFWTDGTFDLTTCIGQATETGRIINYATSPWTFYVDVRLNWAEVTTVWPKANWLQRQRDVARESREDVLEEERKEGK